MFQRQVTWAGTLSNSSGCKRQLSRRLLLADSGNDQVKTCEAIRRLKVLQAPYLMYSTLAVGCVG